ncbi:WXG100 family type VII secretion target [Nocardioides sp. CPCC 205120]|uniref:WXG100 family type VII secretion target n=1 Tax=Nocardioides sp. CPCC 205120 TaxID=3406462 RepID=UPI003B502C7B
MDARKQARQLLRPRPRAGGGGRAPAAGLAVLVAELWPAGPDRPVDADALRRVAADYARRGDDLRRLLHDLEQVVDVVGGTWTGSDVSALIEQSALAWSDAFLGTQGGSAPALPSAPGSLPTPVGARVEVVVVRLDRTAGTVPDDLRTLSVVAAEHLPGAQVVLDPAQGLGVVLVRSVGDLGPALRGFTSSCAERLRGAPRITTEVVEDGPERVARVLGRAAG